MKKTILLLLLLLTAMMADDSDAIKSLYIYKTTESSLSLNEVKRRDDLFVKIEKYQQLPDNSVTNWLKIVLKDDLKDGEYVIRYAPMEFDLSSLTTQQRMRKLKLLGNSHKISFFYKKERDAKSYYFRLLPLPVDHLTFREDYYCFAQTVEEFEEESNAYIYYILFCGFILGILFMAALYNGAMYYYNREKSFLYYVLMQLSMIGVLMFYTGLLHYENGVYEPYNFISLIASFCATLFVRAFLGTAKYLPWLDKLLLIYLFILIFDFIYLSVVGISLLNKWQLYSFFSLLYLMVGFLRIRQGYKPAKFFLIGWTILVLSLVLTEFYDIPLFLVTPLLLGAPIEAIFLAIALAYKIKLLQDEKEEQKELLIHQSKLASMGEMIGNIAHQWRQPLTHLSYAVMNIQDAFNHNALDEVYLDKKVDEATTQIEFMSQTIDDFKNFYEPSKQKEQFSVEEATQSVLEIMSHALKIEGIEVDLFVRSDTLLYNYKNEYKQVLLNLLYNAKDAFINNKVDEPKILIMISDSNAHNGWIVVSDNAGGIEPQNMNKIFEPYFTTKESNSGIGLYMSKMIIEKNMGGKLMVENQDGGAMFTLIF